MKLQERNSRLWTVLSLTLTLLLLFSLAACTNSGTDQTQPLDQTESSGAASEQGSGETSTVDSEESSQRPVVRVATLKGPTGMAMAKMMEEDAAGTSKNDYEFTVLGAPADAAAMLTSGQADIVGVPTNMAANLYNKTEGQVKLININTLGVLYVLERGGETIQSIADLKGKTVYSTGQGTTPEYVFNYILEQNGLDPQKDLTVEYKSEHTELAALLAAGDADIAVLPQPFVTSVLAQNQDVHVMLDLTEEWEKIVGDQKPLAMGAAIVSADFLANHPQAVEDFLTELEVSTDFTNENIEEASTLIEKYDIMTKEVAQQAIPKCNIVFLRGEEMREGVESFLQVMYDADPASVGGQLPDEGFYYSK